MDAIQDGSIAVFHLISGANVVAKVTSSDDDGFHLESPQELIMAPSPQGLKVGLAPFLSFGGMFPELKFYLLSYGDVILPRIAPEKIEQLYREVTGMVLTPTQGLVLVKN
jgi:hypothetical protein